MGRFVISSVLGFVLVAPSVSLACGMYIPREAKLAKKKVEEPVRLEDALKALDDLEEPTLAAKDEGVETKKSTSSGDTSTKTKRPNS